MGNRAVLISIRPKWCELIANGEKKYELRKTCPRLERPFKCYIYETGGTAETPWIDEDGHMIFRGRSAIVGEFVCDSVEMAIVHGGAGLVCFQTVIEASSLSRQEALAYSDGGDVYAWHISHLKMYERLKALSEFRMANMECLRHGPDGVPVCEKGERCQICRVKRPPQSFMYVEELNE